MSENFCQTEFEVHTSNILPADISMFCLSSSNFLIFSSNSCFILSINASFSLCKFEIEINSKNSVIKLVMFNCWVKRWNTETMWDAHNSNHGRTSGNYTGSHTDGKKVSFQYSGFQTCLLLHVGQKQSVLTSKCCMAACSSASYLFLTFPNWEK